MQQPQPHRKRPAFLAAFLSLAALLASIGRCRRLNQEQVPRDPTAPLENLSGPGLDPMPWLWFALALFVAVMIFVAVTAANRRK